MLKSTNNCIAARSRLQRGSTGLQERMAHNIREQNIALQAAEAALNDAENWLESFRSAAPPTAITVGTVNCSTTPNVWADQLAIHNNLPANNYAWWAANGCQHGLNITTGTDTRDLSALSDESDSTNQQPFFLIQEVNINTQVTTERDSLGIGLGGETSRSKLYRISAYAVGQSGKTDILVEGFYRIANFAGI